MKSHIWTGKRMVYLVAGVLLILLSTGLVSAGWTVITSSPDVSLWFSEDSTFAVVCAVGLDSSVIVKNLGEEPIGVTYAMPIGNTSAQCYTSQGNYFLNFGGKLNTLYVGSTVTPLSPLNPKSTPNAQEGGGNFGVLGDCDFLPLFVSGFVVDESDTAVLEGTNVDITIYMANGTVYALTETTGGGAKANNEYAQTLSDQCDDLGSDIINVTAYNTTHIGYSSVVTTDSVSDYYLNVTIYPRQSERFYIANSPAEDVVVYANETHMFFETSYLDVIVEHIDFFVPEELQDNLRYVTPCDPQNGFYCQGDYEDPVYAEDKLFHVKTDLNAGTERFYMLVDYLFDYELSGYDVGTAVPFQTYAEGFRYYYVDDLVIFQERYFLCIQTTHNVYTPLEYTTPWQEVEPGVLTGVPEGFGWRRMNYEVSMGYRDDNQDGALFYDWDSGDINFTIVAEGYDVYMQWDYITDDVIVASYNKTYFGDPGSAVFYDGENYLVITLQKEVDGAFVTAPDDVFINLDNPNNLKMGAMDYGVTEDTKYKYVVKSLLPMVQQGGMYLVEQGTNNRGYFDSSDVCSVEGSDCMFDLSDDGKTLELEFIGIYNSTLGGISIDPSIKTYGESTEVIFEFPDNAICDLLSCYIDGNISHDYEGSITLLPGYLAATNNSLIQSSQAYEIIDVERVVSYYVDELHYFDCENLTEQELLELNLTEGEECESYYYNESVWDYNETITVEELVSQSVVIPEGESRKVRIEFAVPIETSGKFDIVACFDIGEESFCGTLDPWWNSSWRVSQELNIYSTYAQTGFPVELFLNSGNVDIIEWDNDGADLRFTNSANTTVLDHWIKSWDSSAKTATVWVEANSLSAAANTTFYMYTMNKDAVSTSNGFNVFWFFDDFEDYTAGSQVTAKGRWVDVSPSGANTVISSGGQMKEHSLRGSDYGKIETNASAPPTFSATTGWFLETEGIGNIHNARNVNNDLFAGTVQIFGGRFDTWSSNHVLGVTPYQFTNSDCSSSVALSEVTTGYSGGYGERQTKFKLTLVNDVVTFADVTYSLSKSYDFSALQNKSCYYQPTMFRGIGAHGDSTTSWRDYDYVYMGKYESPEPTFALGDSIINGGPIVKIISIGGDTTSPYTSTDQTPSVVATTYVNVTNCRASLSDESYDDMADDIDCAGDGTAIYTCDFGDVGGGEIDFYVSCLSASANNSASDNGEASATLDNETEVSIVSVGEDSSAPYYTGPDFVIQLETDETAECRLSFDDESYADMSDDYDCTDGTSTDHYCTLSEIEGGSYDFYVACLDAYSNEDGFLTGSFFVDVTPPVITVVSAGGDSVSPYNTGDSTPTFVLSTNENASCRGIALVDAAYEDMPKRAPLGSTGGAITTDGTYVYHTFTSGASSFVASKAGSIDVLVVAGGGGAGASGGPTHHAGGGGAGGLVYIEDYAVVATTYSTSIGSGGAKGASAQPGVNGGNSVFGDLTAVGGGGGGKGATGVGSNGGSGGGGGESTGGSSTQTTTNDGYINTGFGYSGATVSTDVGGGGGGAGSAGSSTTGGSGKSVFGTTYAVGGSADVGSGSDQSANTGNGGTAKTSAGYAGGSGIIVVRYLNQSLENSTDCTGDGTTSHTCEFDDEFSGLTTFYFACNDDFDNSHNETTNTEVDVRIHTAPVINEVIVQSDGDYSPVICGNATVAVWMNVSKEDGLEYINMSSSGCEIVKGGTTISLDSCLLSTTCYQETANVSTECGGLNTGSYWGYDLVLQEEVVDGDWDTNATQQGLYINYTKPVDAVGAIWQVKDEVGTENLTLPDSCFEEDHLRLYADVIFLGMDKLISWACFNETDSITLRNFTNQGDVLFEEAVWWVMDTTVEGMICEGEMEYYQLSGEWNVNCTIVDIVGLQDYNDSEILVYNPLESIAWDDEYISWSLDQLSEGVASVENPITVENCGNMYFANINLTAYDLINGSYSIPAGDFSVNVVDSDGGDTLNNDTAVTSTGAILQFGLDAVEQVYAYFESFSSLPPAGLLYTSVSDWEIMAWNSSTVNP